MARIHCAYLALLLVGCGSQHSARSVPAGLDEVRQAELALYLSYDGLKASNPAKVEQLRSACTVQFGPARQAAIRDCVVERWDQPNATGGTVVSQEVQDYLVTQARLTVAQNNLFTTDAMKYGSLNAECERQFAPAGGPTGELMSEIRHCVTEGWSG
jgi:hypothetical protein